MREAHQRWNRREERRRRRRREEQRRREGDRSKDRRVRRSCWWASPWVGARRSAQRWQKVKGLEASEVASNFPRVCPKVVSA